MHRRRHEVTEIGLRQNVQHRHRIAHRAGEHEFNTQAAESVGGARADRNPAATRLESHQAAAGRRNTDGTAAVVGMGDRYDARGHCRGAAATGATGTARQIPGIAGRATGHGLGGAVVPHLRHCRPPQGHQPRLPKAGHEIGVGWGQQAFTQPGAHFRAAPPGLQHQVLDQKRYAREAGIGRGGLIARVRILEELHQGVDPGVPRCRLGARAVRQFRRGDRTLAHQLRQPQSVVLQILRYIHVSAPYSPKL